LPATESQHLDPLRTHPSVAGLVLSFSLDRLMRRAIYFHDQLRFGTVKVRGIDAKRMLATKFLATSLSIA
jgi:hypothetical protein